MFTYPVVFVDIETTGGSYRNSRVLEVAAIRVENNKVVREFSTLLNPETYIPSSITSLTGIHQSDITDAPLFADIADALADILDGAVFVAHNVRFDYSFLKQEFMTVGKNFSPKLLCTVRLSRALYATEKGHSLAKLIERHEIPVSDRHRALEDARAIYYFTQIAFNEHGDEIFNAAIERQIKTQSLPPHLDAQEIARIDNTPGVYIFRDEKRQPIYIGKSISLKKRVMSHFQSTTPKELKISQQVHHIDTVVTGSELAALILESKLIKELKPIYNRLLRRVSLYAMLMKQETDDGYARITIQSGTIDTQTDVSRVYGMYSNRTKAKKKVEEVTRTFQLCPKLMGIEKATGACFSYSLGRCKGACTGKENVFLYNRRLETALESTRIATWPFKHPVVIPVNSEGERVVIDKWTILGFQNSEGELIINDIEPNFDIDEYKIIRRFIRQNNHLLQPYITNY